MMEDLIQKEVCGFYETHVNQILFTFMHLQIRNPSDLQCIQAIHVCQYVCSLGIEPTLCAANQCSTTEHRDNVLLFYLYYIIVCFKETIQTCFLG